MTYWTEQEITTLKKRFPHERTMDLAESMGRTVAQLAQKANRLGLHKSVARRADIWRTATTKNGEVRQSIKERVMLLLAEQPMTLIALSDKTGVGRKSMSAALCLLETDGKIVGKGKRPQVYSIPEVERELYVLNVPWLLPQVPKFNGSPRPMHICRDAE